MSEKNVPTDEMTSSELVALGKRNMACHDVHNAITCYARACSKIAKEHGPLSAELAEPSYLYGRALLETARLEASVLGGTLPEEEEESSSSDEEADQSGIKESEAGSIQDHDATSSSNTEGSNQKESSSGECSSHNPAESSVDKTNNAHEGSHDHNEGSHDQEKNSHDQGEDSHNQEETSHDQEQGSHDQGESLGDQGEGSHDQEETSHDQEQGSHEGSLDQRTGSDDQAGGSHDQEESQEIHGLQLAWEVLELSRVILSKQDTKEAKLRVADVMATLGEIGLESDMFEQAIKDFTASLETRESILPNHDRSIAELHFQLGLTYTLVKDYDNAIQAYQRAKNTLKGTIEHLHSLIADSNATVTEVEPYQKELKELEELLPDLDSKIEDVADAKRQMLHSVMSCMQDEAGSSSSFGAASSSSSFGACSSAAVSKAPATDISHLVRKRPVAKDSTQPNSDPKRSKPVETSSVDDTTASEQ